MTKTKNRPVRANGYDRLPAAAAKVYVYYEVTAALCVIAAMLAVMMFTGYWPTRPNEYNSYTLQACAWLEGRLDLGQSYKHLEIAEYGGKYYVSFPPFPSYIMLPFALLMGENTPDAMVALLVTVIGIGYAVRIYCALCTDNNGLFWVVFLYMGTGYVFIAVNGYVWFMAQTMCFTLSLASLHYAIHGKGFASLTAWACAVGCRPMVILYLPLLIGVMWQTSGKTSSLRSFLQGKWYWCIGPLLLGGSYMLLNDLRFDSVLEFGHTYLPEFVRASAGQFSITYFADNVAKLFRMPIWNGKESPVTFYTENGMALWFVNPMLISITAAWIYALWKKWREDIYFLTAIPFLTVAYAFILCCHRTLGGWHFGNRYLLDVMPWLYFGLVKWKPRFGRFTLANMPLCCFGVSLNLIGTVAVYNYWI